MIVEDAVNVIASVILVGIIAFYFLRKSAARRVITPMSAPEIRVASSADTAHANVAPEIIKPLDLASVSAPSTRRTTAPRYLLGRPRDDLEDDETKAILDMMSGPGICTPRPGQRSSDTAISA